jgi:hypothetical protein
MENIIVKGLSIPIGICANCGKPYLITRLNKATCKNACAVNWRKKRLKLLNHAKETLQNDHRPL